MNWAELYDHLLDAHEAEPWVGDLSDIDFLRSFHVWLHARERRPDHAHEVEAS